MTRYGSQEGSKKGYNPAKRCRLSHHPLITFIADVKLVANMWLGSGETSASNNYLNFSEDTLRKLKVKTISLIRLDSVFFSGEIIKYLEDKSMKYIIEAKFTPPIQRIIKASTNWILLDTCIEICEQIYQRDSWMKARRIIIVGQRIQDRPKANGNQLSLLPKRRFIEIADFGLCNTHAFSNRWNLENVPWQRRYWE